LHSRSLCPGIGAVQACERPLNPLAAFTQQGQLDPQRQNRNGQRNADLRVTLRRKCPIETGAHIVEMPTVNGQPLCLWQCLALRFGVSEYGAIIFDLTEGGSSELSGAA